MGYGKVDMPLQTSAENEDLASTTASSGGISGQLITKINERQFPQVCNAAKDVWDVASFADYNVTNVACKVAFKHRAKSSKASTERQHYSLKLETVFFRIASSVWNLNEMQNSVKYETQREQVSQIMCGT